MLGNLYVQLLMWMVSFIDLGNKKKIINYFKNQYKNELLTSFSPLQKIQVF